MDRRWRHEASCCVAVGVLGGLLRVAIQRCSARLRNDRRAGRLRARRAVGLLLRAARLGNLHRLWLAGDTRLLSGRFRHRLAIPQRASDGVEEGLAPAAPMAVLIIGACAWVRSRSSTFPPCPAVRPPP